MAGIEARILEMGAEIVLLACEGEVAGNDGENCAMLRFAALRSFGFDLYKIVPH